MDLVNESISWLQNGEPVTGGVSGDSAGVLNRPLVQLLANDNGLQDRIDIFADDDGYIKKLISSIKITESGSGATARVQIDAAGLKQYDGTNLCADFDESGNITLGYGTNDKITLASGVLTLKANELDISGAGNSGISLNNAIGDGLSIAGAGANAIEVEAATQYGLKLGSNTSGYGPLHIVNAGVTGASNLHSTYGSAEVDTLAIDDQHDLYIKTGASTWQKVGSTASTTAVVDTATIIETATTDNSVVMDANGLTMRKAAGAVRFDVNEDGSWTLGNAAGERIDFTTGDALSFVNGTLTSPKLNEAVALTATATELNVLDGISATLSPADLSAVENFEETVSATTSEVSVLASKNLNVVGHDGATYGLKLNNTLVTATADELNILDGATLDVDELNILDGVTATTAEINYLDNDDLTAADLQKLADLTASAADLNAVTNFEETISATTSIVSVLTGKDLDIIGHDGSSHGLKLNSVLVTATATELNVLDGITADVADLNQLDGVTVGGTSAGDIATIDDTQTFTNKSFIDDSTYFEDSGDNTKKIQFELSNITTGTTRTLTIPDSDGTVMLTGAGVVSQSELKSSIGEVSRLATTGGANYTLPGGEYGFYPRVKVGGVSANTNYSIGVNINGTTYVTNIFIDIQGIVASDAYAQQRYITSSGEVFWIFVLRDKITKEITDIYAAPDHPCFGNGNDPDKIQHPFLDYDDSIHEIVVLMPDIDILDNIDKKQQWKNGASGKGIIEVFMEEYELDETEEPEWPTKEVTVGLNKERTKPVKVKINKPSFVKTAKIKKK